MNGNDRTTRHERRALSPRRPTRRAIASGDYGVSVITEMELLAWPTLTDEEEEKVRTFLECVIVCELTSPIRERAVRLRRSERLKLPDAIICAIALEHGVELWTNDARLATVPGVVCRTVAIAP